MIKEFKKFISRGNVIDLAVGVLIGSAFSNLVTSLTDNIISPIIGMFGKTDFSGMILNINIAFIHLSLKYGAFLTDVINFIIMAFIVFILVKIMNKIFHKEEKKEIPKKADEVILLEEIRDLLKKDI
ncbi:MAG: large conductance mechanosensitive channel protein MscL [Bacilli bacterium]|nr:large conductance mechanosensitive channel protein MscL [Bacilli bacterium]